MSDEMIPVRSILVVVLCLFGAAGAARAGTITFSEVIGVGRGHGMMAPGPVIDAAFQAGLEINGWQTAIAFGALAPTEAPADQQGYLAVTGRLTHWWAAKEVALPNGTLFMDVGLRGGMSRFWQPHGETRGSALLGGVAGRIRLRGRTYQHVEAIFELAAEEALFRATAPKLRTGRTSTAQLCFVIGIRI